jgi:hypothetical protein
MNEWKWPSLPSATIYHRLFSYRPFSPPFLSISFSFHSFHSFIFSTLFGPIIFLHFIKFSLSLSLISFFSSLFNSFLLFHWHWYHFATTILLFLNEPCLMPKLM